LTVQLVLYHAAIIRGTPQKYEHNDLRWITAYETDGFDFCPADTEILQKIKYDTAAGLLPPPGGQMQPNPPRCDIKEIKMNEKDKAAANIMSVQRPPCLILFFAALIGLFRLQRLKNR
jgi:8-oxo-dGTP diphosphatase